MAQINIRDLLPEGVKLEVLIHDDEVRGRLQETGWGPYVRDIIQNAFDEGRAGKAGVFYTVLYKLPKEQNSPAAYGTGKSLVSGHEACVAGFGLGYMRQRFYTRLLFTRCPVALHIEVAKALNDMIQEYMEELLRSLGMEGPLRRAQRSQLDEPEKN